MNGKSTRSGRRGGVGRIMDTIKEIKDGNKKYYIEFDDDGVEIYSTEFAESEHPLGLMVIDDSISLSWDQVAIVLDELYKEN